MADIFISYAREDTEFVRRLNEALRARGKATWVDWEGILPSAEWLKEIYTAIEAADVVVFVISPDAIASEVCGKEIAHAITNHKRLIPIVYRETPARELNEVVAAHNWIFFRTSDDFATALNALIQVRRAKRFAVPSAPTVAAVLWPVRTVALRFVNAAPARPCAG